MPNPAVVVIDVSRFGAVAGEWKRCEPTPAGAQAQEPADVQADKLAGEPVKQVKQPAGELADELIDEVPAERAAELAAELADELADELASKPVGEPASKQASELAGKLADETAGKLADEPASKLADEPASKPAGKPTSKLLNEKADEQADEQTNKPAAEPTDGPAEKPAKLTKPAKPAIARPGIADDVLVPAELELAIGRDKEVLLYRRKRLLGTGGFSRCFEFRHPTSAHTVAVKVVFKGRRCSQKQLEDEVANHIRLVHPHIVRMILHMQDDVSNYLVLEPCTNGTLDQVLNQRKHLTEPEVRLVICSSVPCLAVTRLDAGLHARSAPCPRHPCPRRPCPVAHAPVAPAPVAPAGMLLHTPSGVCVRVLGVSGCRARRHQAKQLVLVELDADLHRRLWSFVIGWHVRRRERHAQLHCPRTAHWKKGECNAMQSMPMPDLICSQ